MEDYKQRFLSETAGALAPELEGASRTQPHAHRLSTPDREKRNRGEKSSEKISLPQEPKQR